MREKKKKEEEDMGRPIRNRSEIQKGKGVEGWKLKQETTSDKQKRGKRIKKP